jgi:hypothetical protein
MPAITEKIGAFSGNSRSLRVRYMARAVEKSASPRTGGAGCHTTERPSFS